MVLAMSMGRAQDVIKVQAPNMVAVDEQFNLTFIIEGDDSPSDFSWEPGSEFKLIWGPQRGKSSSFSSINGKTSRSVQTTITYILMPKEKGKFTIQPASAQVKKKTIHSSPVTIEVVSNGASSSSGASSQGGQSAASTGDISSSDLFLRLSLSRSSVVVGEPVTATLKLYQRVNIAGFEDAKFPTFTGFWSQEVLAPSNIEFHRENINDAIYNAAVLRSWVIIPQQAGDIAIDPSELVCLVNVKTQSTSRSIFDSFFEDDFRTIRKRVTTDRQVVHVSSLPAGAPASFGGGVGTYSISAKLSKDSLKTHDAASLLVTVSGRGNISLIEAPKISFPPDFEVYDVKATENTDKSNGKTSGSKTFEYPFIPRSYGEFTIEPVNYTYYDVDAHKYVTLTTEPMQLNVARGAESDQPVQSGQIVTGVSRRGVKDLGSDIRYIVTGKPSFSRKGASFLGSPLFFGILMLLLAAFGAIWFALRKLAAMRADVAGSKNRGATKMARKRLSVAGEYLGRNLYTAFYEELHKAMLGYVSDKLNMDMADMSRDNISAALIGAGVPEPLTEEFGRLLEACEFARYSPDAGHEAMNSHYETAVNVISSIDGSMKKKSGARKTVATVIVALCLMPSVAEAVTDTQSESLWTAGAEAYIAGDWAAAEASWQSIIDSGMESADLYYNIGNACFKQEMYGRAILNYERALKVDPSHADARFNLAFCQEFVQDDIDSVPEFFLRTWVRKVCHSLSSDVWTALFLVFLALALGMALVFILSGAAIWKKTGFFAGILALILSLSFLGFARMQWSEYRSEDSAVILRAVSPVKSAPGADSSKDLFILHEGTKVRILEKIGDWSNIKLQDGRQGWTQTSDLEVI